MKILVTGAHGQLGKEFIRQFSQVHELEAVGRDGLDVTNYQAVKACFDAVRPQAVVHCAAYTNVDKAESCFDDAFAVNVSATQYLASQCLQHQAAFVYVSTDYVFDGQSDRPYREYDAINPINAYGRTKQLGEAIAREITGRHYIVRTSWLYGDGANFVKTMLQLGAARDSVQVVNDQIGTPTFTKDLALVIEALLQNGAYGTYHASGNGQCSWYDFACRIFAASNMAVRVEPVSSDAFARAAKRPACSILENYRLKMTIGDQMRNWEDALQEYLAQQLG